MKKRLIVLFFLLVPIASALFYSCICPPCPRQQFRVFTHKSLSLINLDNSGARPVESESLQLNKNAFGIRLYLEGEVISAATHRARGGSLLIQSAYAISCGCPPAFTYTANENILSIRIFTMNDFDSQHPANSDITDLFRVGRSFSTVESFVANRRDSFEGDVEFEFWQEHELTIDLLLMFPPTANNKHQFEVQVALSDGRVLKQQTIEIELI